MPRHKQKENKIKSKIADDFMFSHRAFVAFVAWPSSDFGLQPTTTPMTPIRNGVEQLIVYYLRVVYLWQISQLAIFL